MRGRQAAWMAGLAALVLALSPGQAAAQKGYGWRPAPTPPPPSGWFVDRGRGDARLSYDTCRHCGRMQPPIVARCTPQGHSLMIVLPNQGQRTQVLVGRPVTMGLVIGARSFSVAAEARQEEGGVSIEIALPFDHPFYGALADGATLRLDSPSGSATVPLRGSYAAIAEWQQACREVGAGEQAAPPPAAPEPEPPRAEPQPPPGFPTGPSSASPAPAPAPAQGLARHVGSYEYDEILREPAVATALAGLLSAPEREMLETNLSVHSPATMVAGRLVLSGIAPHQGGLSEAMVTIDAASGALEVGILSGGGVTLYSHAAREALSPTIRQWARERAGQAGGFTFRGGEPGGAGVGPAAPIPPGAPTSDRGPPK